MFDWDRVGADDFMGSVYIDLKDMLPGEFTGTETTEAQSFACVSSPATKFLLRNFNFGVFKLQASRKWTLMCCVRDMEARSVEL